MLATIMKGDIAIEATLAIIATFTMTRQLARTMESLQNVEDGGEQQQPLYRHLGNRNRTQLCSSKDQHKVIRKKDE